MYVLVLLFYGVLFYFYDELAFQVKDKSFQESHIRQYKKNFDTLHLKIKEMTDNEMVTFIEKESNKNKVLLSSLRMNNENIDIECSGEFLDILNLLNSFQTHLLIKNFRLNSFESKIHCELKVDKKYLYDKSKIIKKVENQKNPFFEEKIKRVKKEIVTTKKQKELNNFAIQIIPLAIVSNEVLINGRWYSVEELVGDERITAINKTSIEIQNIKTSIKEKIEVKNE